jgi:hypothetical protein
VKSKVDTSKPKTSKVVSPMIKPSF